MLCDHDLETCSLTNSEQRGPPVLLKSSDVSPRPLEVNVMFRSIIYLVCKSFLAILIRSLRQLSVSAKSASRYSNHDSCFLFDSFSYCCRRLSASLRSRKPPRFFAFRISSRAERAR